MKIELEINETVAGLLEVLTDDRLTTVQAVIRKLIDHAQQGVYRPGAWERPWLEQAFGVDWQDKLEPGSPFGQENCDAIFQRPKKGADISEPDLPAPFQ